MKKIFIIFSLFMAVLLFEGPAKAGANQLHTIKFEKHDSSYNIILDVDTISKVNKKILSENELVLELSNITASDTVNALYKSTESIDNLVIENTGKNKLNIYITAPNVKYSSVIMEPQSGQLTLVGEAFPVDKVIWGVFFLGVLIAVINRTVKRTVEDNNLLIKRDIKAREIALYKQYRNSLNDNISLHSKDTKVHNMLKKIDRKIDERLSLVLRK